MTTTHRPVTATSGRDARVADRTPDGSPWVVCPTCDGPTPYGPCSTLPGDPTTYGCGNCHAPLYGPMPAEGVPTEPTVPTDHLTPDEQANLTRGVAYAEECYGVPADSTTAEAVAHLTTEGVDVWVPTDGTVDWSWAGYAVGPPPDGWQYGVIVTVPATEATAVAWLVHLGWLSRGDLVPVPVTEWLRVCADHAAR